MKIVVLLVSKILRLNKYVQENCWISRRKFVSLIDSWSVFVDWKKIESYSHEVQWWENLEIKWLNIKQKIKVSNWVNIVLFNKPVWYVCSKDDKHNKNIILPFCYWPDKIPKLRWPSEMKKS